MSHPGQHEFRQQPTAPEIAASSSCRSAFDVWLWRALGIRGVPIPYGAPNAAAHIERLIGTLRRECLDHMLNWNDRHSVQILREFTA